MIGWVACCAELCRANTDELTDQAAGTVYHCGPACVALATRPRYLPPTPPARPVPPTPLPPTIPGCPTPLPSLPPCDPFVITSIHFTLKAANVARPFETSPARVAFLLQITTHSLFHLLPFPSTPNHCSFYNGLLNLFSKKFSRLQTIAFGHVRGHFNVRMFEVEERVLSNAWKKIECVLKLRCCKNLHTVKIYYTLTVISWIKTIQYFTLEYLLIVPSILYL